MNVFLDANVYLSFYLFGKDDLETMHKVAKLIEDGEIRVYSNSHLRNEIERNRHQKIHEGFKEVKSLRYGQALPNYCKSYDKHDELLGLLRKINITHKELVARLEDDIRNRKLEADTLIARILSASTEIPISQDILSKARLRVELGNPPGKNRSLGDAIHWECLLSTTSLFLSIVSKDGDFSSPLYPEQLHSFLQDEWRKKRSASGSIGLYETLSSYLSKAFPNFELGVEAQKDELIEQLRSSATFDRTHLIVGALLQHGDFTALQAKKLCECLTTNSKVNLIAQDEDIQKLYTIVKDKAWQLTSDDVCERCDRMLGWTVGEMAIPF